MTGNISWKIHDILNHTVQLNTNTDLEWNVNSVGKIYINTTNVYNGLTAVEGYGLLNFGNNQFDVRAEAYSDLAYSTSSNYEYYTSPIDCLHYSASATNSATKNYVTCNITVCPGAAVTAGSCQTDYYYSAGYCTGNQYLRLFNSSGQQVAASAKACGNCSNIIYDAPQSSATCEKYTIRQGCDSGGSCTGVVAVKGASKLCRTVCVVTLLLLIVLFVIYTSTLQWNN